VTLQERFAKLEPRERTLLLAFGGVIAAIVFFVVPFYLHRMVQTARDDNQEIRDFIQTVGESRKKIEANKLARDAMLARYSKTIPASLIDDAAKSNEVEIAETQKKPDVPHGKRFVEHVTTVKLHKPGMYGLSNLDIKPRAGEADSYDVELGVSTFERKNDAKPEKSGAKPEGSASSKDEEL
jgi:general secretion pathway protein M